MDAIARAMQTGDAFDADGRSAGALDFGAHGYEQRGKVCDLGLARAILHQGFAVGQDSGHQQILGAGNGDFVECQLRAFEPLGARLEVAVRLNDGGAHLLEAPYV